MPSYSLHPDIFHCFSNGYSIIFDLKRDRYFALSPEAHLALDHLKSNEVSVRDQLVLERLCSRAILIRTDDRERSFVHPIAATPADDYRSYSTSVAIDSVLMAIVRQWQALFAMRYCALSKCLQGVAKRKAQRAKNEDLAGRAIAIQIAAAFRAAETLLSSQDRCLARSIALTNQLSERGCSSNLVIGVSARPFRAHAWVQVGHTILNDIIDHVRLYTPIFAL